MRTLTLLLLVLCIAGCGAKTESVTATSSSAAKIEPQPDLSGTEANTSNDATAGGDETDITVHKADAQDSLAAAIAAAKKDGKNIFVHVGGPG